MRAIGSAVIAIIALIVLIASLAGLWRVLMENAEMRLTGDMLSNYGRLHPPKPWRGFEIEILDVSVNGEVLIKAHVSGHMIHTPVEISGTPQYDMYTREIFFLVSKASLPHDTARPMLSRFNAMLNPLATYIAQNLSGVFPVKRIKTETRGGALFTTTVKSVRVDGDAVVLAFHGDRVAAATIVLLLSALLSAALLLAMGLRRLKR